MKINISYEFILFKGYFCQKKYKKYKNTKIQKYKNTKIQKYKRIFKMEYEKLYKTYKKHGFDTPIIRQSYGKSSVILSYLSKNTTIPHVTVICPNLNNEKYYHKG